MITAQTTEDTFPEEQFITYQFSANIPTVTEPELYVFQTTAVYPEWTSLIEVQIASALSEAGVKVIPP